MSITNIIRSLGVESAGQAYFFSYQDGPPPPDHFYVETIYSGISAGTELTFMHGTNPYLNATWDAEFGIFRPNNAALHYPIPFLGYMEVGRVMASQTPAVQEGQVVAMAYGHKSGHTANALQEFYVPLPNDLDPLLGIYVAQMGPICVNGLLHAAADLVGRDVRSLGDGVRNRNIVIFGAGVVGLLTGLFVSHHGAAEVIIVNNSAPRLEAAQTLGLTCISENEIKPWRYCKERWHHGPQDRGADLVFQCKAYDQSLQEALRCLRPQGTVIDMAFYQDGSPSLRLGEEFHHSGLTIRSAQISHVPIGLERVWTRRQLANATIELLYAYGHEIRSNLITHVVRFDDGPDFINKMAACYQPEVIQAVLALPAQPDLANSTQLAKEIYA
jgi:NADPH:quinone reductase-like Zn-dependent oxidoreductase